MRHCTCHGCCCTRPSILCCVRARVRACRSDHTRVRGSGCRRLSTPSSLTCSSARAAQMARLSWHHRMVELAAVRMTVGNPTVRHIILGRRSRHPACTRCLRRLMLACIAGVPPKEAKHAVALDKSHLDRLPPSDLVMLPAVNEPMILHTLKQRFLGGDIYTAIGEILISINPFQPLPIYTPSAVHLYATRGSSHLPPHIFAVRAAHPTVHPPWACARMCPGCCMYVGYLFRTA